MKTILLAATALAFACSLATQAHAISRIRADQNSCAALQQTLIRETEAVIRWPSTRIANYFLYDRYVSRHYLCALSEELVRTTVPAADNPRCVVHRCERVTPRFNFRDD